MPKPKVKFEFLTELDKTPPCIIRWMAYEETEAGVRLLTNTELSKKCGLAKRMIQRLSAKASFEGVKAEVIDKYLHGCDYTMARYLGFLDRFADKNFFHVTDTRQRRTVFRCMGWSESK